MTTASLMGYKGRMGYTTDFQGEFTLNKQLDSKTHRFLEKFSETRRMARKLPEKYGVQGEFYVDGGGDFGQAQEPSIIDYNSPPKTQPGLWCQWIPNEDGTGIKWNDAEKFYNYVEWLEYIIKNFLAPKDYVLNGEVKYQGEDPDDFGIISVTDNKVLKLAGKRVYQELGNVVHLKAKGDPSPEKELLRAKVKAAADLLNEVLIVGYHEELHGAAVSLDNWMEDQDD